MSVLKKSLFLNFGTTTITPTDPTGSAITLDKITDIELNGKSVQKAFMGDAQKFAGLIVNASKTRSITLKGGNIAKFLTVPEDSECTVVVVLLDAKNGTGPGALTITAVRATPDGKSFKAGHGDFATGDMTFNCAGDTGDADPITVVQAADT